MISVFYPYLGKPGAMRGLPSANDVVTADASRSETVHTLLSGGTVVERNANAKRTYVLPFQYLEDDDVDLLTSFYEGLFGNGPWVYVDPTVTNVLTLDQSACGARVGQPAGWLPSSGTIASSGDAPSEEAPTSGVFLWSGIGASASIQPCATDGATTPDLLGAPVNVPPEFVTASVYVKSAVSGAVTLTLVGFDSTGAVNSTDLVETVTLSTGWQRVSVTASPLEPTLAASAFVLPQLSVGSSHPASLSFCAAQVEYADRPTKWRRGHGSPRVIISGTPGRAVQQIGFTNQTLTLAET